MGLRVTCKHCGGSHPAFYCKKSTAARKDVQAKAKGGSFVHKGETQSDGNSVAQSGERPPAGGRSGVQIPPTAGTQALPVDTNVAQESYGAEGLRPCEAPTKRGRGRPRTITDMKVYKAMKQREYRARKLTK